MADLLVKTGEALFGSRWQSELARKIDVSDRTVRRWVAGADDLPPGVAMDLLRLVTDKLGALEAVEQRLRRETAP